MNFELHKRFRYECDWTESEYQKAQETYLSHLRKIDFNGRSSLVRFLGKSFFHDADVKTISILLNTESVEIELFTVNDLEDINDYRKKIGVEPISWEKYADKPIIYKCTFGRVTDLSIKGKIDLARRPNIIDTELDYYAKSKDFVSRISFSDQDEIEILFKERPL